MATADQSVEKTTTPFLLLVIGEPHTPEQRELLLQRVIKELFTWDDKTSGCDLDEELQLLAARAPVGEDGQPGEKLIEYQSDLIRVEVLVNPTLKTLTTRLRGFLLAPTTYRHLVHAGLALRETGCWLLQDGTFSAAAFADLLRNTDVLNAAKQGTILGTIGVTAHAEGDWSETYLSRAVPQPLAIRLNRESAGTPKSGFVQFGGYISSFVRAAALGDLLPASGVVGNIRFSRPTIYVFPGCQGDSCLFGVSGFSLLVDGGYARRSCFWDFARHLDRVDAMLVTHVGVDNVFGLASFADRKARDTVHPEIGHVLMNAVDAPRHAVTDGSAGDSAVANGHKPASLVVNVADEALAFTENIKKIGLVINKCIGPIPSAGAIPSINLYHKVGHGSLDLHILNPTHDSRPLKEFLTQWSRNGNGFSARGGAIPLANASSICALLVWRPSSPTDTMTRILFPGNTPQLQIFEALDKMKAMSIFQHASCSERDLSGKGGAAVKKVVAKAAAPPAAAAASKAPTPVATSAPKPASLPMASKSEKPEAKKPHSAVAKKEPSKTTSPTKPTTKETKKVPVPHAAAPAESPADSQHSQEKVPEDETSTPEAPPTAELVDISPGVGAIEEATVEDEKAVAANPVEASPASADGGAAVGDLLDLQAVPEPQPLRDEDQLQTDAQVEDTHHLPEVQKAEPEPLLVDEKSAAAAADVSKVVDDDKDIDTTEVPVVESAPLIDVGGTVDLEPTSSQDLLSGTPFDGEQPASLPSPTDVVEDSLLVRHDSLDEGIPAKGNDENLEAAIADVEIPKDEPQLPNVDLFNVANLGASFGAQPSMNPFVGISDGGADGTIAEPQFDLLLSPGIVTADVGETEKPPAVDLPEQQRNVEERDSLERDQVVGGPEFDPQSEWGHPMSLPAPNKPAGGKNEGNGDKPSADKKPEAKKATSPTKPAAKQVGSGAAAAKHPAKKEDEGQSEAVRKGRPGTAPADSTTKTEPPKSARTTAPIKKPQSAAPAAKVAPLKPVVPFYVDLAYIPAHGAADYVGFDFFRRVRARYYVLSTVSPDPATLGALLDAKATWEDPEAEVTIIPTYDAEVLRYWMGAHRDQLSQARVDVAPSANRCTIQLQDHDTGCSAYRLEF